MLQLSKQFMRPHVRGKKFREEWVGPLQNVQDIYEKFKQYCLGKLKSCPTGRDNNYKLGVISHQQLVEQILTLHLLDGVGKVDIFIKSYLEFFFSEEKLKALVDKCKAYPFHTYMASVAKRSGR